MPETSDLIVRPRTDERSITLLTATATVGDDNWPVRVRNISASGIMVDSEHLVSVGSQIAITRGTLHASGTVWQRSGSIGVKFIDPIALEKWVRVPTRHAIECKPAACPISEVEDKEIILERIAEEIAYVARIISSVSDLLCSDPVLRVRHATRLQELCIGEQMLQDIASILQEDLEPETVRKLATGPMRQRLLRVSVT